MVQIVAHAGHEEGEDLNVPAGGDSETTGS